MIVIQRSIMVNGHHHLLTLKVMGRRKGQIRTERKGSTLLIQVLLTALILTNVIEENTYITETILAALIRIDIVSANTGILNQVQLLGGLKISPCNCLYRKLESSKASSVP